MSNDPLKPETDVGFELLKVFGIIGGLLVTLMLLLCLNPAFGAFLVAIIFPVKPMAVALNTAMQKVDAQLAREADYTPSATIRAPLGYGEGLRASQDIEANLVLVPKMVCGRTKFPVTDLGQCSPLSYSSLIGKKTKTKIKCGQFFTTANVEF